MDFLKLSRSRSGSSSNKKRSPIPSPSGGRRSSGPEHLDSHTSSKPSSLSLLSPSHALDQRGGAAADGGDNVNAKSIPLSPNKTNKKGLPLINENDNQHLQVIEFSFPSLLSPPNPAFVSGSEARGILINAQRPSMDVGAQTRSSASQVATSSSPSAMSHLASMMGHRSKQTSISGPYSSSYSGGKTSAPTMMTLPARPPHLRNSVSSDSMLAINNNNSAGVKPDVAASTSNSTDNSNISPSSTDSRGRGRIRFAPLPDPRRPRSHSTGRDIWFDDDSENHIHINTRDGTEASPSSWSSMNGSSAQSNSLSMSLGDNMEESLSTGKSPASHRRTSSTLSKLLQPLKLGRSKSRENDKQHSPDSDQINRLSLSTSPSLNAWMNGGEPLARSISTGAGSADIERQRKEEFRSSGVPLKKSSTQESSELARSAPQQRRILYPSVAQGGRRRNRNGPNGPKVVEPEFVEWTNPSARVGVSKEQAEVEDDGSGMAWIKKRRAERERKAKEEAEAAATKVAEAKPEGQEGETAAESAHAKASSEDTVRMPEQASGIAVSQPLPVPDVVVILEDDQAAASGDHGRRLSEDSQSTLEAATTDGQTSEAPTSKEASEEGSSPEEEDDDDDDSSSSEGEDGPEENLDDLTAAEIEEEERLAEEARRTTGGASREVYHSHERQASTYTFDAPSKNNLSGAPSSLNIPPFERTLSYSSIKSDVPRSIATSHPGDWPLREHVVPPC